MEQNIGIITIHQNLKKVRFHTDEQWDIYCVDDAHL